MSSVNRNYVILLIISAILIGAYATIGQVLIFRECMVVFYGNELCIGIIFGSWLFGVASGAYMGGRGSARLSGISSIQAKMANRSAKEAIFVFTCILAVMALLLPLQVFCIRTFRCAFSMPPGQLLPITSIVLSSAFIIIPFSFTIGFIFPFTCNIFTGLSKESATDIGNVYILEGLGSLLAGLIFTFILVSRVSTFETISIFSTIVLIDLIFLLSHLRPSPSRMYLMVGCALLLASYLGLLLSQTMANIDRYLVKKRWTSTNPNIQFVESVDSKYENIVVGKQEAQYSVYGNGQYTFSFPDEYLYSQIAHLVMIQHPCPAQALLIGGGLVGLIREMLKHPVDELDYVELDPKLIQLTRKYLPLEDKEALSDKRVTIFNADGRYFIKHIGNKKYDLIFANTPDPSTALLNRFYTREFFQEIKRRLNKGGIFVTKISSAVNYIGPDVGNYTGSVYHTIASAFPYVRVSPGQTNYFFAANEPDTVNFDISILAKRYKDRNIKSDYFSGFTFYTILQPEQVSFIEDRLKRETGFQLNTDQRPITYFFNLLLWDQFTGGKLVALFHSLGGVKLRYFLIPIFILLALRLIYVGLKARFSQAGQATSHSYGLTALNSQIVRFNSLISIITIGFAGIAIEIVLIYAFQNIYGYVYERIGLIVSLFMFGLASGGYIANKWIAGARLRIIGMVEGLLFILCRSGGHSTGSPGSKPDCQDIAPKGSDNLNIRWSKALLKTEVGVVCLAILLPLMLRLFTAQWFNLEATRVVAASFFLALITIAGFLTGLGFPIASKLYLQTNGLHHKREDEPERPSDAIVTRNVSVTAGLIDSADHCGAFLGALLTGVIFVPLFGQTGACIIIAGLNISSAVLLWHFIRCNKIIKAHQKQDKGLKP